MEVEESEPVLGDTQTETDIVEEVENVAPPVTDVIEETGKQGNNNAVESTRQSRPALRTVKRRKRKVVSDVGRGRETDSD